MLASKNEVLEWLELNNTPFWILRKTPNGGKMFEKSEPEDLSLEESKQYLSNVLEMLGNKGTYHIDAWDDYNKKNASKQWFRTGFRIDDFQGYLKGYPPGPGYQQGNIPGIGNIDEIEHRIGERIRKDIEFDRLKTENEELIREIDSASNQISQRLLPYIPHLMDGLFGIKTENTPAENIAGIPDEDLEDHQNRLEKAFKDWFEMEKELSPVIIVEKIVELAHNNPQMYSQAKKLLFS